MKNPLKLKFRSKRSETFEISGEQVEFFSARSCVAGMFSELVEDIVGSVSWMTKDPEKFVGRQDTYDKNINSSTHVAMPMDTAVLNNIEEQRKSHVSTLVQTLLAGTGQKALASLIVSSLRKHYEAQQGGEPEESDVDQLIAETDMETFVALSAAAVKVNARAVFQGFPKDLLGNIQKKAEKVLDGALDLQSSSTESSTSSSPEDSPTEKPPTSPPKQQ